MNRFSVNRATRSRIERNELVGQCHAGDIATVHIDLDGTSTQQRDVIETRMMRVRVRVYA